jgi:hypothetical protein
MHIIPMPPPQQQQQQQIFALFNFFDLELS